VIPVHGGSGFRRPDFSSSRRLIRRTTTFRTTLAAVVVATLLVTAGTVAPVSGATPVDVDADDQRDDHPAGG
jgi:hypothetical protein